MRADDPRHGSVAGYLAHRREPGASGKDACQPCRDALARYENHRQLAIMHGRPLTLSGIGTARRIQALVALGWNFPELGRRLGTSKEGPRRWASGGLTNVRRVSAERIAKLYDELCLTFPPEDTPKQRAAATRARNHAIKCGYVSCLAWDDIDNDPAPMHLDPAVDIDEIVVERILAGHKIHATTAERDEAMRRWTAAGRSEASLCDQMGWKPGRYNPKTPRQARDVPQHGTDGRFVAQPPTREEDVA